MTASRFANDNVRTNSWPVRPGTMRAIISVVFSAALLAPMHAQADTRSKCQRSLEEGGWTVSMSDKFNEFDYVLAVLCIVVTGGAGTFPCLGDALESVLIEVGWDLLADAAENPGEVIFGPGNLMVQVGICSKTYPIIPGVKGTDHYVYVRYKRDTDPGDPGELGPEQNTLAWYHEDCDEPAKSRTPSCTAAIHRACAFAGWGGAGVSQEVGLDEILAACLQPGWYGGVPLATLQGYHPGCTLDGSQSANCISAAHRYCVQERGLTTGIPQEVGSDEFGIACFTVEWYGDVLVSTLRSYHPGCDNVHMSQSPACVAAIHRYCASEHGLDAGISQEVGADRFGVACFRASRKEIIKIR